MDPLRAHKYAVLGCLEEAGEEELACLANTLRRDMGEACDIDAMRGALIQLLKSGLIGVATDADPPPRRLESLPFEEARAVILRLESYLAWSPGDRTWSRAPETPGIREDVYIIKR